MTNIAEQVDIAVRAVCPIDGVSIGRIGDKSTWRLDFKPEATDQEMKGAQEVVSAFDVSAASAPASAPTLADVIAVLSPDQAVALNARLEEKAAQSISSEAASLLVKS